MTNLSFPNVASITSEALQLKIRQLLPSQAGFGSDLMAQNVIVPIIDLTASAEGSDVRQDLQTAIAFGSQTAFDVQNATTTIINNTGFFRVFGVATIDIQTNPEEVAFRMTDGATTKQVWAMRNASNGGADAQTSEQFDFVVFLRAGDSLIAHCGSAECTALGSTRQIADINGTLVQPVGFTPS